MTIGSPARGALRLLIYALWTLPLMPVQALALLLGARPVYRWLPVVYHRVVCRILGIRVEVHGAPSREGATLFVSNHVSYLDIEVLSTLAPMSFVAKSEVARWPFFGWLAKLQGSVFVERRPRATGAGRDEMQERLERGDNLVLFPEGTSGDGTRVLPFRSSFLAAAQLSEHGHHVRVQPVTITYARLDGIPLGRLCRPYYAWYGDMELASHLWHMVALGEVAAVVVFHPPTVIDEHGDRKRLNDHCFKVVSRALQAINRGRYEELPPRLA